VGAGTSSPAPFALASLPPSPPAPGPGRRLSLVTIDRNHYSVPCAYVGRTVQVAVFTERLEISHQDTLLATHARCSQRGQFFLELAHYPPAFEAKPHAASHAAVVVLLDRAAHLPLFFLLSPANRNDLPFAYPSLWLGRFFLALPIRVVRADGAYWGKELVCFIVAVIGARPIIPFNRKKQPPARVRHLVYWPLSYLARAVIERFFAAAKHYYGLDARYHVGWDAILVVALVATKLNRPDLRLSPTRVLAHYLPFEQAL
jgi:hypothetical protein